MWDLFNPPADSAESDTDEIRSKCDNLDEGGKYQLAIVDSSKIPTFLKYAWLISLTYVTPNTWRTEHVYHM